MWVPAEGEGESDNRTPLPGFFEDIKTERMK
jgi:hypothetical protein